MPMLTTSPGLRHSQYLSSSAATNLSGRWRKGAGRTAVCDLPISASTVGCLPISACTVGDTGQQLCPGKTKTEAHGELLTRPNVHLQSVLQTEMNWLLSLRLGFSFSRRALGTQVYSRSPVGPTSHSDQMNLERPGVLALGKVHHRLSKTLVDFPTL